MVALVGSNQDFFDDLKNSTVNVTGDPNARHVTPNCARVYLNDARDGFPSTGEPEHPWNWLGVPAGATGCVSFRPALWELINPDTYPTVAGRLDTFLQSAPSGPPSLLALWHEASGDKTNDPKNQNCGSNMNEWCRGPGGAYSDYFAMLDTQFHGQGGSSGLLTAAQTFVQQRARTLGANVLVGAIEVVSRADSSLSGVISDWMAPGLDFYLADVYDNVHGNADPAALLHNFLTVCKDVNGGPGAHPTIGIGETNSRFPGRRPFWFTSVWSWLQSNGFTSNATTFLTYWNHTGLESGDWIPDDWATIDSLYGIMPPPS